MSDLETSLSRIPSQVGVRASFSRPSTRTDGEDVVTKTELPQQKSKEEDEKVADIDSNFLITEVPAESENDESSEQQQISHEIPEDKALEETGKVLNKREKKEEDTKVLKNIYDDEEYDTDLDETDDVVDDGPPYRQLYKSLCDSEDCFPCSYFVRHLEDKEVNMKHHGLKRNEICVLAKVLRSIFCINTLDLEDNWIRNSGCRYLCQMMEDNESIYDLNLSQNKFGQSGVTCVSQMMRINHTLQQLSLSSNDLDDSTGAVVIEALEDTKLKGIDLSRNLLTDKTGIALQQVLAMNDYLETLDLSWNIIRGTGAKFIAKGLKENIRLKVLDLSWNGLGEEGGCELAKALNVNTTLQELYISANRLNDNVAKSFEKVLRDSENLKRLSLSNNPISTLGAVGLVTALLNSQVSGLELLDLNDISVEYEFLKTLTELKSKKDVAVKHGSILRSGNTKRDLGKQAVDSSGPKKDVVIVDDSLIVNNKRRLQEIINRYYLEAAGREMCEPEELIQCIKILSPSVNTKHLTSAVNSLPRNEQDLIPFAEIFS